jgi:hypothetical protein
MGWYSCVPPENVLDSWINNKWNVLFHGKHGVGKTSMIFDAFKRKGWVLGKDYLYFSAATIDPWVDLIGVPSKTVNDEGEEVLKLIRPVNINNKTIKAFFVDEFNRSHKKVRNAMMELIQFKSINGLTFSNLEIVWAAINPSEDNDLKFDVEKLDPAQEDRFQIHLHIPYKPSVEYFTKKFNDSDMAVAICKWWNDQPDTVKNQISPRRLEYAVEVFQKTNDLRYVIPSEAHLSTLKQAIQCYNPEKTLKTMIQTSSEDEIRKWLAIDNNLNSVKTLICTNNDIASKVLHLLPEERLVAFISQHKKIQDQIKKEPNKFVTLLESLSENATQKSLKNLCQKLLTHIKQESNNAEPAKSFDANFEDDEFADFKPKPKPKINISTDSDSLDEIIF